MNDKTLSEVNEIIDEKLKEMYKNWNIAEFTPIHTIPYLFMNELSKKLKKKQNDHQNDIWR